MTTHRQPAPGRGPSPSPWGARARLPLAFAIVGAVGLAMGLRASRRSPAVPSPMAAQPERARTDLPERRNPARDPVPRFQTGAAGPARPGSAVVPGQPGYSASALVRYLSPRQLFEQESRNEKWAPHMESALPTLVQGDLQRLLPQFLIRSVECRTTICKVSWDAEGETASRAKTLLTYLLPPAVAMISGKEYYVAFSGQPYDQINPNDPTALLEAISRQRKQVLDRIRRQDPHFSVPRGIQAADWPRE